MKWQELYDLFRERRLQDRRKGQGLSKDVLKQILIDSDKFDNKPKDEAPTASGSGGGSEGGASKLSKLLQPHKRSEAWVDEASAGDKGENIMGMFLNVDKAGYAQKADPKQFEDDSRDGVLPSVAVDKFLQASQIMETQPLAILLGHEHKFGKGNNSFKRSVITGMICGREEQLDPESRRPEIIYVFVVYYIFWCLENMYGHGGVKTVH